MPKSSIYTRSGDAGVSQLLTGTKHPKHNLVFDVLGTLDELAACVGLAREALREDMFNQGQGGKCWLPLPSLKHAAGGETKTAAGDPLGVVSDTLAQVQSVLIDLGAHVASVDAPPTDAATPASFPFDKDQQTVKFLESVIDDLDEQLPPLKNFILPSGGFASCHLHQARAVCRRAERCLVRLATFNNSEELCVDKEAVRFINRLSDLLFVAARTAASKSGQPETPYSPLKGFIAVGRDENPSGGSVSPAWTSGKSLIVTASLVASAGLLYAAVSRR